MMGMGATDVIFSIFPVVFGIMFVLIVGVFVVVIAKGVSQWHRNNQSPVLTVAAVIVGKRGDVRRHSQMNGDHTGVSHTTTSTTYYATFEVESGDRMELCVSDREYGLLAEGDRGRLTFQGTRYLGFERDR